MSIRYTMIPHERIERLMNTYRNHHRYVNEEYEKIKSKNNYCNSDRDRFVYHFFSKLKDKYIILLDRVAIAWSETGIKDNISRIWVCEPISIFSTKFTSQSPATPTYRYVKKYLHISGFNAINQLYGEDYIEMLCHDIFGDCFRFKITHNNLLKLQFKEITKMEFDMVANLFADDREPIKYKVERFNRTEVIKRKKPETVITTEELTVMAKDEVEARNSLTNVLNVTRIE